MVSIKRATISGAVAAILLGASFSLAVGNTPVAASIPTQLELARDALANCQLLAENSTGEQLDRAQKCVEDQTRIIDLLAPTPTPTQTTQPTQQPTTVPPTTPPTTTPSNTPPPPTTTSPATSTPSPTTSPLSACPPLPAFPDAACTGYRHTGVTLRSCPSTITRAGTYDSCRFTGTLVIAADGVTVSRSLVDRGHLEGSPSTFNLRGVKLVDVQIIGAGNDGYAGVGNNNYTCLRCDLSGGLRGFAMGGGVLIQDSYAHDFYVQTRQQQQTNSVHQTAASTHGGSGIQVLHSNLRCTSDHYACSSGISLYAEDSNISNVKLIGNRIHSDASYGLFFDTKTPGKPYAITNLEVRDNVISCDEYGPVANFPATQAGNIWSNNRGPDGRIINPS